MGRDKSNMALRLTLLAVSIAIVYGVYQLRDGGHNEEVLVQTPNDKLVQDFLHCANCVRNALQMAKGTYQACARGDSDACKMPDDQEFAKFAEIESRAESDAQDFWRCTKQGRHA